MVRHHGVDHDIAGKNVLKYSVGELACSGGGIYDFDGGIGLHLPSGCLGDRW